MYRSIIWVAALASILLTGSLGYSERANAWTPTASTNQAVKSFGTCLVVANLFSSPFANVTISSVEFLRSNAVDNVIGDASQLTSTSFQNTCGVSNVSLNQQSLTPIPGTYSTATSAIVELQATETSSGDRFTWRAEFSGAVGAVPTISITKTLVPLTHPVIISDGGGTTAAISVAENQTVVTDVQSTEPDGDTEGSGLSYTLSGGADQGKFGIVASSGVLTFNTAPDFETPTDSGSNNVYDVQVTVTDSGALTDVQNIAVTVTDLDEIAPILAQVIPVPTLDNDTTPSYTFNSDEAGAITVVGDCSLGMTNAAAGNNTITFEPLAAGIHSNCTVTVTDAAGNASSALSVSSFTIDTGRPAAILTFQDNPLSDSTNSTSVAINFSENVTGFELSDLVVSGGTLTGFTSSSAQNYAVTFTATDGVELTGRVTLAGFKFTDLAGNTSGRSAIANVTIDTLNPTLAEVTPAPTPANDATPTYVYNTSENGTISYGGDCSSGVANAFAGNNAFSFNALAAGTHSNCTITVTDAAGNASDPLSVSSFTIDTTAPMLTEVTPAPTPSSDTTPTYIYSTTEAGTISYGGDCASGVTNAGAGNNAFSFNALAAGTHSNCTITVTDAVGNASAPLSVSSFTIIGAPTTLAATSGSGQSATISTAFTNPLVATITDTNGNPVPGITVNFAVPGSGASAALSATSGTTDANGQVSVTATANGTGGNYNVTASSTGLTDAPFALTNGQADQAIAFTNPGAQTFLAGGTVPLTATGGASGNGVTFTSNTAGVCTVAGSTVTMISTGTCTIAADQAGDGNFNAAPQVVESFAIDQADQAIAFTNPGAQTFLAGGTVPLTATGGASGNGVTFTSNTAGVCTVAGSTVTMISTGTCTIAADQAGDGNFNAAPQVVESFAIDQADQAIAFTNPGAQTFLAGGTVPLTATGGASGNGVIFTSNTAGVCTVAGSTVTMISAGTCTIAADQAGNGNFNAAPQVVESFAIDQADQAIAFTNPGSQTFAAGGTVPLTATGGASGNGVTFTSNTAGICTVAGSTATMVSAGTCTIAADQAGNGNFNAAPQFVDSFTIDQADQAIAFTNPGAQTFSVGGTVPLTATGGASGNGVTFTSNTAGICTVAGSTVTMVTAGTCTIAADQAGNGSFNAAPQVVESFAIDQGVNVIAFTGPADTDITAGTVSLAASASSGLGVSFASTTASVCTVAGTTVTLVSVGTCSITASQAGDTNFVAAADVVKSFATTGGIVIAKTKAIISNFVSQRAGRILSGSPDIASRLRRTSGGSFSDATGFSPIGFSGSGTLDKSKMAFSTSLRQVIGAVDASKKAQRRELGEMMALGEQSLLSQYNSGLQPGFDIWVKGSLDHATSDNRKSDLGLLFIGADYHISSNTLVGVLAQLDWSDEQDTTNAFSADGRGWMVGPYLATRLGKNLLFDGRAAYGQSSNNISPLGTYEDSFDTTRWLVSGTLTGDYNMGGWRFSPHIGVSYFEETQKAYTDSLNNTIAAQTISLGRMTFGPEVSTSFMAGNGTLISPHIGVKGIWDFDKAQTINLNTGLASGGDNDLRASIEAGITTQFTNGWQLAGEAHYDGIGDDSLEAYGGSVKLTVPLN